MLPDVRLMAFAPLPPGFLRTWPRKGRSCRVARRSQAGSRTDSSWGEYRVFTPATLRSAAPPPAQVTEAETARASSDRARGDLG